MARATASVSITERNSPIVRVRANRSARTRPDQWRTVKCWYELFSDNSGSTRMRIQTLRGFVEISGRIWSTAGTSADYRCERRKLLRHRSLTLA